MTNFKRIVLLLLASAMCATSYAQSMPDDLKAKLKDQAQKLYPNDKNERRMWYTNQFYAWQALQSSSPSIAKEDYALIKATAEKKFPLDFSAQSTYINRQSGFAEGLKAATDILGADSFNTLKAKLLKDNDSDFAKVSELLNKQAQAKKDFDALTFSDATKLSSTKTEALKKSGGDFVSALEDVKKSLNLGGAGAGAATQSVAQQSSSSSPAPIRHESVYERGKRQQKEATELFIAATCRNRETSAVAFMTVMDKKALVAPITCFEDLTEAEFISNLGKKIDTVKGAVLISKSSKIAVFLVKEHPAGAKEITPIKEKEWANLLGQRMIVAGKLKGNLKTYFITPASLSENTVNFDSRLPFGVGSGALCIAPDSGNIGGMLLGNPIKLKICEDFTDHSSLTKLVSSMRSKKVEYIVVRLDTINDWERLDIKKLQKQEDEYQKTKAIVRDYIDFFTVNSLRSLRTRKYIGKFAKRAFEQLDVKKLSQEEHNRRYRSYLNSVKNSLPMEAKKIKPETYYSLRRTEMEEFKEIFENMHNTLEKLLKSDFTTFMKGDATPFRPN